MALRNYPALRRYQIHSVRPGRVLGNGAYGEVLEARIPGAVCAVKKMHNFLETQEKDWVDQEMVEENRRKFVQECELMSCLRHPHIVQFLGVCEFPGSDTPALVTELLLTDLHSLLLPRTPRSRSPPSKPTIPLGFKYCILCDVARGLLFLHSQDPPIVHRDLTATNVLLNSAMVAKIADLGVARLIPEAAMVALTKGPGNAAYMPPEAQGNVYNKSLDVFSFGVLCLFTLTQIFPDPLPIKYQENEQTCYRTEVQRRRSFIEQLPNEVKEQGRLFDSIHQCLCDNPGGRPTAHDVLVILESAATETAEEYMKKSVLELVQMIKSEREQRIQEEKVFQQVAEEKERAFHLETTETRREFELLMEEKEKECRIAVEEKERELGAQIQEKEGLAARLEQEKEAAVQQREREIVEELTGILEGGRENCVALTGEEGAGGGGMGRQVSETYNPKESSRAVMIIGSDTLPGLWQSIWLKNVIPQTNVKLSANDSQLLTALGLPPEQGENLDILLALYNKTDDVFSVQVSKPRKYILEQIEFLLQNSAKKPHGAVLHYYGNGQKNTGDWCFNDGFITFRDIADLYMKHSRGRGLTIVTDCHSSGQWVRQCAEFLDEQGVKPCGHSAREKGVLLRVAASCEASQYSAELVYTTQGMELEKDGHIHFPPGKQLGRRQHTFVVDFTVVRCGKGENERCSISVDATWSTAGEVIDHPQSLLGQRMETLEQQQQATVNNLEENINLLNQKKLPALMVIGSTTLPTGSMESSVVPQSPAQLSDGDRKILTDAGIPPNKWNNLNALWALYNRFADGTLLVQVSRPGMELSRGFILQQIEFVLQNAEQNVTLHYYGNGQKSTGDWCFNDGFITFRDIADLYMKHSRGRVLTIVTDCHSSGQWVSQCAEFLDEVGVKLCRHSAMEKGVLLKVAASCKAGQDSAELVFTVNESFYRSQNLITGTMLRMQQQTFCVDFTSIGCGTIDEACTIASDATWQKAIL